MGLIIQAALITLCAVCTEELCNWSCLFVCMWICHNSQNITHLASSWLKKSPEKCSGCSPYALRHCECDSWLLVHSRLSATPVSLLMLLCPLRVAGPGVQTSAHWLVGMLLCIPQCWLDKWVTIKVSVTNCSVLLASAVQQVLHWQCSASQHAQRTMYVFYVTLVRKIIKVGVAI